ncbi:MAG: cytochrome P450 [Gemmatimonadota bacterium]
MLIGHLRDFRRDPLGFLSDTARRYGPFAKIRFGRTTAYLLNDPELLQEVLVTRRRSFIKARVLRAQSRLLGNGLLLNEGESWLAQRRLAQPAFHRERIAAYAETIGAETERALSGWESGSDLDIHSHLRRMMIAIVAKALFGADVGSRAEEIGEAIDAAMSRYVNRRGMARILPVWIPEGAGLRYVQGVSRIDRFVFELVRQRRQAIGSTTHDADAPLDLLSMLMEARDESGNGMGDRQLRDEAVTLFIGGFDTPSLGLAWAWYLLATHPPAAAAAAEEADRVLGDGRPAANDLRRLRYLDAVVKETLRLYPPAWILSREAVEDVDIGGHCVNAGSLVLMSQWVTHRDVCFFADPERFVPERWLDGSLERELPRFSYFPFGGGPRVCIGAFFGMMELVLALAMIARRYRFVLPAGTSVAPWPTMTLRPRGLRVTLAPRGREAARRASS